MAYIKYTGGGRLVTVDSDGNQVTYNVASTGWTLFDSDSRESETDPSFDSTSQEWGTFTVGEDLYFYSDNGNSKFVYEFAGTFQDGLMPPNTIYVVTWEDPDYGTYYGLISPGNGKDASTTNLNNTALVNTFNAQGTIPDDLAKTPIAVPCFLPGTLVATPAGERMVEDIAAGDMVLTAEGKVVPVKWIGRSVVSTRFGPAERLMPVRFAAGSLGGACCRIAT